MKWIIGLCVVGLYLWFTSKDETTCPKCGEDTVEVGYKGYKRKCMSCGWENK